VRQSEYNGITNLEGRTEENKQREWRQYQKINEKNTPFDNYNCLPGMEFNAMMLAYFGADNMRIIQNAIVAETQRRTGKLIPYVEKFRLGEVMKEEWEAALPYEPSTWKQSIVQLNNNVVSRYLKTIPGEIKFYEEGRKRISTLHVNLFRPMLTK
jgi:hypothetical protein